MSQHIALSAFWPGFELTDFQVSDSLVNVLMFRLACPNCGSRLQQLSCFVATYALHNDCPCHRSVLYQVTRRHLRQTLSEHPCA